MVQGGLIFRIFKNAAVQGVGPYPDIFSVFQITLLWTGLLSKYRTLFWKNPGNVFTLMQMNSELAELMVSDAFDADEYLPPELRLDPYHPDNDTFMRELRSIRSAVQAQTMKMRPRHVAIVKDWYRGNATNKEIAQRHNCTPKTVSAVINSDDGKRLYSLLAHLSRKHAGPTEAHRKAVLHEIMVDNKKERPQVSIAAVQEMNRMDGIGKDKVDTKVVVQIDNNIFPKGPLDRPAQTFESRIEEADSV